MGNSVVSGQRDTKVMVWFGNDFDTFSEYYANELTKKIETVCKQPFFIKVEEYCVSDEDGEYSWTEVGSVAKDDEYIVASPAKMTHMVGVQYYYVKAPDPEESYAGKVIIEVRMLCSESENAGDDPDLNLAVKALFDLAFMQYYVANEKCFSDLDIRYDTTSPQIKTPISII